MKKLSIRNVLVPIDFSTISIQTIETAKRLVHRFDASIHLVHVHHWQYPGDFMGSLMPVGKVWVSFQQHRRKRLAEELKMMAQAHGLSPGLIHPLEGASAFHEICRLAQQIPADLIVMPTHGYTGLRRVLLGSTAERVVRYSPCPVFIVREKKQRSKTGRRLSISTILVPVDFSSSSQQGLQYAIGFANEFAARMILLHAVYLGYIYSSEETPIDIPLLQKTARENAEHQMHKLERTVNFGSAKFETMFTEGSPVQDICAFAKDRDTDLIITSTHGLTGLKRVLIGSIAEKVVRHAPCSVLVVPSNPKIRLANLAKRPARR